MSSVPSELAPVVAEVGRQLRERGFAVVGEGMRLTYTLLIEAQVPLERAPEVWDMESDIEDTELVRDLSQRVGGRIQIEIIY